MNKKEVKQLFDSKEDKLEAFVKAFDLTAKLCSNHEVTEDDVEGYLEAYNYLVLHNLMKEYEDKEVLFIKFLMVNCYRYTKYYWRARSFAGECMELLKRVDFDKKDKADVYFELGTFYKMISELKLAIEAFTEANKLVESEATWYSLIVSNRQLGLNDEFNIKDNYLTPRVKNALEGRGFLKIDPIENSIEYRELFDQVHEEALRRVEKEGNLHLSHQMWNHLSDVYREHGIMWRSPAFMNPRVRFD